MGFPGPTRLTPLITNTQGSMTVCEEASHFSFSKETSLCAFEPQCDNTVLLLDM